MLFLMGSVILKRSLIAVDSRIKSCIRMETVYLCEQCIEILERFPADVPSFICSLSCLHVLGQWPAGPRLCFNIYSPPLLHCPHNRPPRLWSEVSFTYAFHVFLSNFLTLLWVKRSEITLLDWTHYIQFWKILINKTI